MKKRKFRILSLILMTSIILIGCNKITEVDRESLEDKNTGGINLNLEQLEAPKQGEEVAIIKTNHGDIKLRLFPQIAPKAVENFVSHAKSGYYDGVTFHRVMNDFMIQGGDPDGSGRGGNSIWDEAFEDEFDPSYHNLRGSLSMANAGLNTNGSQFFIVQKSDVDKSMIEKMESSGEEGGYPQIIIDAYKELGGTPWLDFQHTVFGQVYEGMDVVDKIAALKVNPRNSMPVEAVIMETIEIVEYK